MTSYAVLRQNDPDRRDRFVEVNGRYLWDSSLAAHQAAELHADVTPTASPVTFTVVSVTPLFQP